MTADAVLSEATRPYSPLESRGLLSRRDLEAADKAWLADAVHPEVFFRQRLGLTRGDLRQALGEYYKLPVLAYDERLPIPEDLARLAFQAKGPVAGHWFPVCRERDMLTFAVSVFDDPETMREIESLFPGRPKKYMACLREEVEWFAQDFAMRDANGPVGVQRTAMAFWRNTMALWRTKLACQRTNLAYGRTWLNVMRWSLGLIGMGNSLFRMGQPAAIPLLPWIAVAVGLGLGAVSLWAYVRQRRAWKHTSDQSLVEATSAVLHFLEEYHFLDLPRPADQDSKQTMLGRLGDCLTTYSSITMPRGGYRERITLARERNVLAAQRTVLACYRTLAARARTGLAFFRTGVTILSLGLGLLSYFGLSAQSSLDVLLIAAGVAMIADGAAWYWPVRKEYAETPRCIWFDQDDD
ncbi:general secretion pathway protein GspE [Fundidesulfovibrio terrae]|uniref:general secretion pathway protein GspE n=1 Tax=Fundidesulfovibrio terrae TaxID=2922866 RepID=UPI001FAF6F10|nr:general secretion pathway protein GspE [Fundidesulfovibrio terrae]